MKKYILILITIVVIMSSCEEPGNEKIAPTYVIGDEYSEGTIFYIFTHSDEGYVEGEQHGYIASPEYPANIWGCNNIPLYVFGNNGETNTEVIIAECGINNAAGYSNDNGFWLPSIEELEILIDSEIFPNHLMTDYYWTSEKASYSEAYAIRFSDGNIEKRGIPASLKFIAIKQF